MRALLSIVLLAGTACAGARDAESPDGDDPAVVVTGETAAEQVETELWIAAGTEPFWSLRGDGERVVLEELVETIDTVRYETTGPLMAFGRPGWIDPVAVYPLATPEGGEALVVLRDAGGTGCSDGMSEIAYPWHAALVRDRRVNDGCARPRDSEELSEGSSTPAGAPTTGEDPKATVEAPPLTEWEWIHASGDEPFWSLVIGKGTATHIDHTRFSRVAYDAREPVAAVGRPIDPLAVVLLESRTRSAPGGVLFLRSAGPAGCAHMSGLAHAYTATLVIDREVWVGCAREGGLEAAR